MVTAKALGVEIHGQQKRAKMVIGLKRAMRTIVSAYRAVKERPFFALETVYSAHGAVKERPFSCHRPLVRRIEPLRNVYFRKGKQQIIERLRYENRGISCLKVGDPPRGRTGNLLIKSY